MVRILNFICVAVMGLSILALYHVSERTRVARMELEVAELPLHHEHAGLHVDLFEHDIGQPFDVQPGRDLDDHCRIVGTRQETAHHAAEIAHGLGLQAVQEVERAQCGHGVVRDSRAKARMARTVSRMCSSCASPVRCDGDASLRGAGAPVRVDHAGRAGRSSGRRLSRRGSARRSGSRVLRPVHRTTGEGAPRALFTGRRTPAPGGRGGRPRSGRTTSSRQSACR